MVKLQYNRGDVYWVKLDPAVGSETKKTRPGVIVSNNLQNNNGNHVVIIPATTAMKKLYPFEVVINIAGTPSKFMADQIRAVDYQRLSKKIGELSAEELNDVDRALKLVLALT